MTGKKAISIIVLLVLTMAVLCACGGQAGNGGKTETAKVELKESMVSCSGTFTYTGEEVIVPSGYITVTVNGKSVNASAFTITYENNIDVGTATMILTARSDTPYVKGSVRIPFVIQPSNEPKKAGSKEELLSLLTDGRFLNVRLETDITVEEGETLVVPSGIKLGMFRKNGEENDYSVTLINHGTIRVEEDASFTFGGDSNYVATVVNDGIMEIEGTFGLNYGAKFYNSGRIDQESAIENFGIIYTDMDLQHLDKGYGTYVLRKELTADAVLLRNPSNSLLLNEEGGAIRYNANSGFSFNKPWIYYYNGESETHIGANVVYEGYDSVGTATVRITTDVYDREFFGEVTLTYDIGKGSVTVDSAEELLAAKASGMYDEYTVTAYPAVELESFTVAEGETLIVTEGLTLSGTLTNNGNIIFRSRTYCYATIAGTLVNNGSIVTEVADKKYAFISGVGTIENNEGATIEAKSVSVGGLTNDGTITVENLTVTDMENAGTLDLNSLSVKGEFVNTGDVEVSSSAVFIAGSSYEDDETATLTFLDEAIIRANSFICAGKVVNSLKMTISEDTTFDLGERFENNGTLYAFTDPNAGGDFVLRKNLSTLGESVALSFYEVVYDAASHKPTLTIGGEEPLSSGYGHTLTYAYADENIKDTLFRTVGEIEVTYRSTDEFYEYYGSVTLRYNILYGSFSSSDKYALVSAIENRNYSQITCGCDVTFSSNQSLAAHQTLDMAGHKLTISGCTFTNSGTLIIAPTEGTGLDACGLHLTKSSFSYNSTRFINNGTLTNGGVILNESGCYWNDGEGTVDNSGEIYTYLTQPITASGTGSVFARRPFSDGDGYLLTLEYAETVYDGTEKRPVLSIVRGADDLNAADYEVVYGNNINAGSALLTISTSDPFDHDFYGSRDFAFTIKKATRNIGQNVGNSFFDCDNYDTFVLTANWSLSENVVITQGAKLVADLSAYTITYNGYTVDITDGKLSVTVDTLEKLSAMAYAADEITLAADIGTSEDTFALNFTSADQNANYVGERQYSLSIDAAGRRLPNTTIKSNVRSSETEIRLTLTNSGARVPIGYSVNNKYSFSQLQSDDSARATIYLSLNNFTVYGGNFYGGRNDRLVLDVENCEFIHSGERHALALVSAGDNITDRTISNFTNCSFTSVYSAVKIWGGANVFSHCTFTSTGTYSNSQYDTTYAGNGITVVQKTNSDMRKTYVTLTDGCDVIASSYGIELVIVITQGNIYTDISRGDTTVTAALGASKGW